jgi:sulfur-oxidizing protein SoxA
MTAFARAIASGFTSGIASGFALCMAWVPPLATAQPVAWPDNPRLSGNAFLPPGLLKLQGDAANSPVSLWLDKGTALWTDRSTGPSCQSCHGAVEAMKASAPTFPRLAALGATRESRANLINLEDQIVACSARTGRTGTRLEDDDVLALSAVLHNAAKGLPIDVKAPLLDKAAPYAGEPAADHAANQAAQWQARLNSGTQLFSTRMGRINLACVHCHEQNVGRQMRADVISPGNPTGFPILRMTWQRLGSMDRRLRACYSGVQAVIPPAGDPALRDLELYLKVRANGMLLDGPSIRR